MMKDPLTNSLRVDDLIQGNFHLSLSPEEVQQNGYAFTGRHNSSDYSRQAVKSPTCNLDEVANPWGKVNYMHSFKTIYLTQFFNCTVGNSWPFITKMNDTLNSWRVMDRPRKFIEPILGKQVSWKKCFCHPNRSFLRCSFKANLRRKHVKTQVGFQMTRGDMFALWLRAQAKPSRFFFRNHKRTLLISGNWGKSQSEFA